MRTVRILLLCTALFAPMTALSQTSESQSTASEDDIIDEVIAYGTQTQRDPAMSAFLAGDFETAEIEFNMNARCAQRVTRNFEASRDAAQNESIRADNAAGAASTAQPVGGAGGGVIVPQTQAPTVTTNVDGNSLRNKNETTRRTCSDRGYQIYMRGMSQLQLGKREEAQASLKRATKIKRTLFDAHFRLGLMAYQDQDLDEAADQLKSLRQIEKRCKACQSKAEIQQQVAYLANLLE